MKTAIFFFSLLAGFALAWYSMRGVRDDRDNLASLLDDSRKEFTSFRDEAGREIVTQRQTITSLRNALDANVLEKEELEKHNLRQLNTIIRLEGEVKRLLEIEFEEPVIIEDSVDFSTYLKIPQQFLFEDEWTKIRGEVIRTGINISELTIRTGETIYLGYQKRGFLRRSEPVVIVEYDNPYMSTVSMENVQIITRPPFYNRPWWYRGQGILVTGVIFYLLN